MTVLEAMVSGTVATGGPLFQSNGPAEISSALEFHGSNGSLHTNDDLLISGNPDFSDYATASGTMTDQGGGVICDASASASACADAGYMWVYEGANGWNMNGNSIGSGADNHTFYAETDATISGKPGSPLDPLQISVFAEGNIQITGNAKLEVNIDGEHYVIPSPKLKHQAIVGNLCWQIRSFLEDHPLGNVYLSPLDVVLSESTRRRDETLRRALSERMGVKEYWIVDSDLETVKVDRAADERFERVSELSVEAGDSLSTPACPGLVIPLDSMFRE